MQWYITGILISNFTYFCCYICHFYFYHILFTLIQHIPCKVYDNFVRMYVLYIAGNRNTLNLNLNLNFLFSSSSSSYA